VIEAGSRRREIDDVASELFHANGYAATSVRDIARALDIQGASLYAHVASKEDVLFSIVDRAAAAFERGADAATGETQSADPVERLAALVEAHVDVVTSDPQRASVFRPRRFRDVITDGIAVGAFRASDTNLAATFILTALNGIATWYRPDGRLTADRVADHYVDLALRSLSEDHR